MKSRKPKSLKEQVKECFRTMPFAVAFDLTAEAREKLLLISTRARIYRMCVETSKFHGMYNL